MTSSPTEGRGFQQQLRRSKGFGIDALAGSCCWRHYGTAHFTGDQEHVHRWNEEGKGTYTALLQNGLNIPDLVNTCKFMSYGGVTPDDWAAMLSEATDWDINARELRLVSERTLNLQRLFNM